MEKKSREKVKDFIMKMRQSDEVMLIPNDAPSIKWTGRPCVIRKKGATFHRWTEKDGRPYAIVEWADGHVELVTPNKVRFTDRISFTERLKKIREGL